MATLLFVLSCLLNLYFPVNPQIIRSPLNTISTETILEIPRNVIEIPRNVIGIPRNVIEIPRNFLESRGLIETPRTIQQPIIASPPFIPISNPTTLITDCTPSVCQNLVDTINLMVVSNLLQNTLGDVKTLKMVAPLLKQIRTNPNFIPNLANPNFVAPNCMPPKVIASNLVPPNFIAPLVGPNIPPNFVAPNVISPKFAPNPVNFNAPPPISNSALLANLLKMLGNTV